MAVMSPSADLHAQVKAAGEARSDSDGDAGETILIPDKQASIQIVKSWTPVPYTPPTEIDTLVKLVFVNSLRQSLAVLTNQYIRQLREDLMGLERVKALILRCHTPEEIKYQMADEATLRNVIQQDLVAQIKASALGHATAQVVVQVRASKTDSDEGLQRLTSTLDLLKERPIAQPCDLAKELLHYLPLHAFVEEQKEVGCLIDDIAWEDHGNKAHHKWDHRLNKSLEHMNKVFNAAIGSVDVSGHVTAPLHLVESIPASSLTHIVEQALASHPTLDLSAVTTALPQEAKAVSPSRSDHVHRPDARKRSKPHEYEKITDDLNVLAAVGHEVYQMLSDSIEAAAQQAESAQDWSTLQAAAYGLLNSGSINSANALRWGKALQARENFVEAERAFTLALTILNTGTGMGIVPARLNNSSLAKPLSTPTAQSLEERQAAMLAQARGETPAPSEPAPKVKGKWRPPRTQAPAHNLYTPPREPVDPTTRKAQLLEKQRAAREALLGRGQVRRLLAEQLGHTPSTTTSTSQPLDGQEDAQESPEGETSYSTLKRQAELRELARLDLQAVVDSAQSTSGRSAGHTGYRRAVVAVPGAAVPSPPQQSTTNKAQADSTEDVDLKIHRVKGLEELLALTKI